MKKTLVGLMVAMLLAPAVSFAQTPQTQEEIVAQLQSLMLQLVDMVAKLTVQLNEAIAAQNAKLDTQTQTIQSLQSTVEAQNVPVLGAAVVPSKSVTLGEAQCQFKEGEQIRIPVHVVGSWKELYASYYRYPKTATQGNQYTVLTNLPKQIDDATIKADNFRVDSSNVHMYTFSYPDTYTFSIKLDGQNMGQQTVVVPECN